MTYDLYKDHSDIYPSLKMSLNSSKLMCWSPLMSASWTISNSSSSVNISPILVIISFTYVLCILFILNTFFYFYLLRTNFISELETRPFPSWYESLCRNNLACLSLTLSKTLKACLRSSGVSFSASLLIMSSTNSEKSTEPEPSASASCKYCQAQVQVETPIAGPHFKFISN